MQAVISAALMQRGLVVAAIAVLAAAGPGHADVPITNPPPTDTTPSGHNDNGEISANAGVPLITYPTGKPGPGTGPIASVDVNWTPPPCWFGPKWGAKEFKSQFLKSYEETAPKVHGTAATAVGMEKQHFSDGLDYPDGEKGYKDFNVDQDGKGQWWGVTGNPDASAFDQMSCNDQRPAWVPNGERPPATAKHVITPAMLSRMAYARTHVPGVTITTSPQTLQTVNLPTWIWLREKYTPVKVRASVNLGNGQEIWAETTAVPRNVHIAPGTPDATVFPASGNCPIGPGGKVGTEYTKDAKGAPPCGVTYLRSTEQTGPYQLNVTATWNVSWIGSDGPPAQALPNGTFGLPKSITVQEIQTIVR